MSVETSKDGPVAEIKKNKKADLMMHKGILMVQCEIDEIQKFEMRDDDIWVCSFPRSGKHLSVCLSFGHPVCLFVYFMFIFLSIMHSTYNSDF